MTTAALANPDTTLASASAVQSGTLLLAATALQINAPALGVRPAPRLAAAYGFPIARDNATRLHMRHSRGDIVPGSSDPEVPLPPRRVPPMQQPEPALVQR